jgi:hypothetical protein
VYKIETILKKRKKGWRVQYLVKLLRYPESFNIWIFKQDPHDLTIVFHFHIDFMIDFAETHVEFILDFRPVLFPSMVLMILLAEE